MKLVCGSGGGRGGRVATGGAGEGREGHWLFNASAISNMCFIDGVGAGGGAGRGEGRALVV